ncbi:MAG: amino acid-binding protein, partial [Deltaproteobacteria bacterium]|nr:amino acid-binding protein [Deltaproteobacteria bacterium]
RKDIPARVDEVVAVQMEDKPGQLADLLEGMMESGIKIKYGYALAGMDSGKAIMIFRFEDNDKAIEILTQQEVHLVDRESFNKLAATG